MKKIKTFKLAGGIVDAPLQGICKIDVDKIVSLWDTQKTFISLYDREYRLCNDNGLKVTISSEDAQTLIDKLDLVKVQIKPFSHAWSYMTKQRLVRYNAARKVPDLVVEVMEFMMLKTQGLTDEEEVQYFKGLKDSLKMLQPTPTIAQVR